jgi:hypothetical protein
VLDGIAGVRPARVRARRRDTAVRRAAIARHTSASVREVTSRAPATEHERPPSSNSRCCAAVLCRALARPLPLQEAPSPCVLTRDTTSDPTRPPRCRTHGAIAAECADSASARDVGERQSSDLLSQSGWGVQAPGDTEDGAPRIPTHGVEAGLWGRAKRVIPMAQTNR